MQPLDSLSIQNNNQTELLTPPLSAAPPKAEGPASYTVLVVDDDQAMRELLYRCLKALGLQVILAEDGIKALEQIKNYRIDLILLDILLPILDGFAVCAAIRQYSEIPILMVTALNQLDSAARAFQVGANGYVTKPITVETLKVRIQTFLNLQSVTLSRA